MKLFARAALAAALAAVAATSAPAATNLLTNGSFENGFTGWTHSGTAPDGYPATIIDYNSTASYPTGAFGEPVTPDNAPGNPGLDAVGTHAAYFVSDLSTESLSQTVSLIAGTSYTFGFDYYLPANGAANANDATFSASLNGTQFATFTASNQPATQWLTFNGTGSFIADTTGAFQFNFATNGAPAKDFVVDRVYLAATDEIAAVPEPASWAMMVCGFGLLGGAMRRKDRARSLFA